MAFQLLICFSVQTRLEFLQAVAVGHALEAHLRAEVQLGRLVLGGAEHQLLLLDLTLRDGPISALVRPRATSASTSSSRSVSGSGRAAAGAMGDAGALLPGTVGPPVESAT